MSTRVPLKSFVPRAPSVNAAEGHDDALEFPVGDENEFALDEDRFWGVEQDSEPGQALSRSVVRRPRRRGSQRNNGHAQITPHTAPAPANHVEKRTVIEPINLLAQGDNVAWADYAFMEALAHAAALSDDDAEAERLAVALVPLALRLIPQAESVLWPALPGLLAGVSRVARQLRRRPANRPLLGLFPMILRCTAAELVRNAHPARQATPSVAAQTFARHVTAALHLNKGLSASAPLGDSADDLDN